MATVLHGCHGWAMQYGDQWRLWVGNAGPRVKSGKAYGLFRICTMGGRILDSEERMSDVPDAMEFRMKPKS